MIKKKYLLFLITFIIFSIIAESAPVVQVPIYQQKFVKLLLGNPGHYITLRIDYAMNDTLVLFNLPSGYSNTYVQYEDLPSKGSELLYIGCFMIRIPVKFDNSLRKYDTKVNYGGIIGLGYYSQIWNYWQKMTISSSMLVFGMYDQSLARRNYKPFEMHTIKDSPIKVNINNDEYNLYYKPGDTFTRLPLELYHHVSKTIMELHETNHFTLQLEKNDYTTKLPTGFEYSLLKRQSEGSNDIILGEHASKSLICHYNFVTNTKEIHPSYNLFDYGDTQPSFDSISGIILCITISYWLVIIISEKLDSSFKLGIASKIEIYGYIISILFVLIEHRAYKCERYIQHYLSCKETNIMMPFTILFSIFFINSILGMILSVYSWSSKHFFSIRRAILETTLILALWITQISNHQTIYDHLLLIAVSSLYCILRLLSVFNETLFRHFHKHKYQLLIYIILSIYSIWSILFCIIYNLNPMLNRFWYSFPDKDISIILMFTLFIGLPFLFFFTIIHISKIRNTILFNEK